MNQPGTIHRAILATDGSEEAVAATTFAAALAWPPESTISVASVVEVQPPSELAIGRMTARGLSGWRRVLELSHGAEREQALRFVADAAAVLRERHPAVNIEEVILVGEPAAELLSLATSGQAQLILVGARG